MSNRSRVDRHPTVGRTYDVTGSTTASTSATAPNYVLIQALVGDPQPMSISPDAGRYLVHLTAQCSVVAAPATVEITIYVGGAAAPGAEIARYVANTSDDGAISTQAVVDVEQGQAIEGRFAKAAGSTISITRRTMTAVRVATP